MAGWTLIMATRAESVVGFPALLNEAMRGSHYELRPEYAVYAMGIGVGLAEFEATLLIHARGVEGVTSFEFGVRGSSVEMAIQEVARVALFRLRYEHAELWEGPFTYVPVQGPDELLPYMASAPVGASPLERVMAETISAYAWAHQSLRIELEETRRRYLDLQVRVEPCARAQRPPRRRFLDELPSSTVHEDMDPLYRYPSVEGVWAETTATRLRMSVGLHVPQFPRVRTTREALLGPPEFFPLE